MINDHITSEKKSEYLLAVERTVHEPRFIPSVTTNLMAEYFKKGEDIPEEDGYLTTERCPFLCDDACLIYPVRPFACRCLVSEEKCQDSGYAYVDPFVLTVSTAFQQYIEHIDPTGFSGNLIDVLFFLRSSHRKEKNNEASIYRNAPTLIPNHPITQLLIPPNHIDRIKPLLVEINNIIPKLSDS